MVQISWYTRTSILTKISALQLMANHGDLQRFWSGHLSSPVTRNVMNVWPARTVAFHWLTFAGNSCFWCKWSGWKRKLSKGIRMGIIISLGSKSVVFFLQTVFYGSSEASLLSQFFDHHTHSYYPLVHLVLFWKMIKRQYESLMVVMFGLKILSWGSLQPSEAEQLSRVTEFSVRTEQPLQILFLAYSSFVRCI